MPRMVIAALARERARERSCHCPVLDRQQRRFGVAAALVFELAVLQATVADHETMRHADQLPVGEHRAGALAAVVEPSVWVI